MTPRKPYPGPDRRKTDVEKHVQTIVVGVCMALLLWAGATMIDMKERQSRLEEKMTGLIAMVTSLQGQLVVAAEDRYRSVDARRDFESRDKRIEAHDARIDRLEAEVKARHSR
jgi:hypothetical protein